MTTETGHNVAASPRTARGSYGKVIAFMLLFAIAFGVRVYRLNVPGLDFHPLRQYYSACLARGLYFEHASNIPEWRREAGIYSMKHHRLLEPRVLPVLAAIGYYITGGEHLTIPRLISIVCWLAGGWFLYKLLEMLVSGRGAFAALAFYLLMPFSIMASRTFQPDPLMIMMTLWTLYLMIRYDSTPTFRALAETAIAAAIAVFVKPQCVFVLFATFGVLMVARKGLLGSIKNWHWIFYAIVTVAPTAIYAGYVMLTSKEAQTQATESFRPWLFLQAGFWSGWKAMIGQTVGYIAAVLALSQLILLPRGRYKALVVGLWLGYLLFAIAFCYHIHTHDYYSLQLLPIVAISLAGLAEKCWAFIARQRPATVAAFGAMAVVVFGIALVAAHSLPGKKDSRESKARLMAMGEWVGVSKKFAAYLGRDDQEIRTTVNDYAEIGNLVRHSTNTFFLDDQFGETLMYYGELFGVEWPKTSDMNIDRRISGIDYSQDIARFEKMVGYRKADYFIVTMMDDLARQKQLQQYLADNYDVVKRTDRFAVYHLKHS